MEPPQNRKELQWFIGLCGYYRRFIPKYAGLVFPLLKLLKSAAGWCWNEARTIAFDRVRKLLQHSPVLRLPQFDKPFFVTTDASDTAVGGVFSQFHDGVKHPVALSSRKLSTTEKRWPAYEKDLFAFKFCFEKWRTYLLGQVFILYADNSACKWFFRKPTPSPKLLRRLDFIGQFTFKVFRRPGTTNVVVNTLLCSIVVQTLAVFEPDPAFCERVKALYLQDPPRVDLIRRLSMNDPIAIRKYRLEDNLICIKEGDRVVFPRDDRLLLHLLVHYHEDAIMAHPGVVRPYLALRQNFAWKKMRSSIEDYVRTCETCARNKSGNRRRGLLQPLPIPTAPWTDTSMDFVTGLPLSQSFNTVYVVVCSLNKRARYLPSLKDASAEDVARSFSNNITVVHGVPRSIVSDRDPRFLSNMWRSLMNSMHIEQKMAVSHRAQADGHGERQIRTLEDALRCSVSLYGDDWTIRLPCINGRIRYMSISGQVRFGSV